MYRLGQVLVKEHNGWQRKITEVVANYGSGSNLFGYRYEYRCADNEAWQPWFGFVGENTLYKWLNNL